MKDCIELETPLKTHVVMLSTPRVLIRILPRDALARSQIKPALAAHVPRSEEPTLVDILLARKRKAESLGHDWPSNLRIESKLDRSSWRGISPHIIKDLKKLTKEK